jgi:hypothetical protein
MELDTRDAVEEIVMMIGMGFFAATNALTKTLFADAMTPGNGQLLLRRYGISAAIACRDWPGHGAQPT